MSRPWWPRVNLTSEPSADPIPPVAHIGGRDWPTERMDWLRERADAAEARNRELARALEGVLPLAIAWAARYQGEHALPAVHPVHQQIIATAQRALSPAPPAAQEGER